MKNNLYKRLKIGKRVFPKERIRKRRSRSRRRRWKKD